MSKKYKLSKKYRSATHYILSGLIPYTEANLKLAFKPSLFFNDLEKLGEVKASRKTLENAYYRSIKNRLININSKGTPALTDKGYKKLKPFKPIELKNSHLMVIFDIPEEIRHKRRKLRYILRQLEFRQVQKSVWVTKLDVRKYLRTKINLYSLSPYVKIYEVSEIR